MAIDTLGANALASNSVTTAKIAADAVTSAKIPAGAVVVSDIADDSVTTAKIADDAITQALIAAGAVGNTEVASGISASKLTTGTLPNTIFPANTIRQIVTTSPTDETAFSSTSYTDATGFSLSITPTSASSKIKIRCFAKTLINNAGQSGNATTDHRIVRTVGGTGTQLYYAQWQNYFNQTYMGSDFYPTFHTEFVDSPNTTSAVTYKIQGRKYSGNANNGGWIINDENGGSRVAVFELIEISQ